MADTCQCGEIYSTFSLCAKCNPDRYAALKMAMSPPLTCKDCGDVLNTDWKIINDDILVRSRVWCGRCEACVDSKSVMEV
jgi:hypothetical protein